ncbi:MAG: hypothetical protein PHE43_00965 [Candidatus Nanoarchaeia archaeon]|nr:hypothetical protein [Candidatus Nanoarchaeia archaeon]
MVILQKLYLKTTVLIGTQKMDKEKLDSLKNEIKELKDKLNSINAEKETWFAKKEELKKVLAENITKAKAIQDKKKEIDKELKNIKKERDKFNAEVKIIAEELKKVSEEKRKVRFDKEDKNIKETIERLELSIQTDVLSFSKEKATMVKLKELKDKLKKSNTQTNLNEKYINLRKDFKDKRKIANDFHSKLEELRNNESYSEFLKISKEINRIKKEQEDAFDNFIKFKKEFSILNNDLKEKLLQLKVSQAEIPRPQIIKRPKRVFEKREEPNEFIEGRKREIEQKIKNKKKLTTEDLWILQGDKI